MWTLNSMFFRDRRNGWAVGFFGQLMRSRPGGAASPDRNLAISRGEAQPARP
jgi:hypothetical protein